MALNKKRQLTYRLASISRVVSVGTKRSEVHKYALLFPLLKVPFIILHFSHT